MKAVVSNRIYLEVTQEYKDFLDKELTYTIASYNPTDPPLVIKNMSRIRTDLVSIPVGRLDLIPNDYEVVDKREYHEVDLQTLSLSYGKVSSKSTMQLKTML